jgi:hypothetical protein
VEEFETFLSAFTEQWHDHQAPFALAGKLHKGGVL